MSGAGYGREVVTIQLGEYANYVGAHFWNIEDELLTYNDDGNVAADEVLSRTCLRVSESKRGAPVYTPRLVSCGLNGSLGAISSQQGTIEKQPATTAQWHGKVDIFRQDTIEKSSFQKILDDMTTAGDDDDDDGDNDTGLEGNVRYWTDYSKVHLHSRNLMSLENVYYGVNEFDVFSHGYQHIRTNGQLDTLVDKIRYLVEECDHMQGFQCLVDGDSGFGGVCLSLLEEMHDEYSGRIPIMVVPCTPHTEYSSHNSEGVRTMVADVNTALCSMRLSANASVCIPLSSRGFASDTLGAAFTVDTDQRFHTSAILGAALHSLSLPYRLTQAPQTTMRSMVDTLTVSPVTNLVAARMHCAPANTSMAVDAVCASYMRQEQSPHTPVYRAAYMADMSSWWSSCRRDFDFVANSGGLATEWTVTRGVQSLTWPELDSVAAHFGVPVDVNARYNPLLSFLNAEPCHRRDATYIKHPLPLPRPFPRICDDDDLGVFVEAHTAAYQQRAFDEQREKLLRAMRHPIVLSQFQKYDTDVSQLNDCVESLVYCSQRYAENV